MLAALRIPIFQLSTKFHTAITVRSCCKVDVSKIYFHLNWCFSLRKTIELSYCWWIWWIFRWIVLTWAAFLSGRQIPWSTFLCNYHPLYLGFRFSMLVLVDLMDIPMNCFHLSCFSHQKTNSLIYFPLLFPPLVTCISVYSVKIVWN